jgi:hypothetical protein
MSEIACPKCSAAAEIVGGFKAIDYIQCQRVFW